MKIRIAQISDTHLGLTKMKSLYKMFQRMKLKEFDMLLHCGDYCGGIKGHRSVRSTVKAIRETLGDVPFASTIGNHCLWYRNSWKQKPSLNDYAVNYAKILEAFRAGGVHFLDEDGPFRFRGATIVGHTGWYSGGDEVYARVNDFNFLPVGLCGDTHRYLQRRARDQLQNNLAQLTPEDKNVIFASHFPVLNEEGNFFYWDNYIAKFMQNVYDCRYFFNGHAHERHEGPVRFECGSHYGRPDYQIVEVEFADDNRNRKGESQKRQECQECQGDQE